MSLKNIRLHYRKKPYTKEYIYILYDSIYITSKISETKIFLNKKKEQTAYTCNNIAESQKFVIFLCDGKEAKYKTL